MINSNLGPYEIRAEIGKGGMATVYRAYQPAIDREVAIKVIHSGGMTESHATERFQREAQIVARLEHPHILPIYDFNGTNNPPYIVMRLLDGGTLRDVVDHQALSYGEIGYILRQIASALDYAHSRGIVHRDVKPSNILLDQTGNIFVADFGMAHLMTSLTDQTSLTQAGAAIGTPAYMAPEQGLGASTITAQADIYALGVMLFEMLTGTLPYNAESGIALMIKHINEPIPSACKLNPMVPPAVDVVFQQVLAKMPENRYRSASAFVEAAIEALGGVTAITLVRFNPSHKPNTTSLFVAGDHATFRDTVPILPDLTINEQQKQVTALFLNLVEVEEVLFEKRDEEETALAMKALSNAAEAAITQYGGTVYERTRQTLQVTWGLDNASEDDAERAIHAALVIRQALNDAIQPYWAAADGELPLRMALHTGFVLQQPADQPGKRLLTGQTLNVVQKIAELAANGLILVTQSTYRQVIGVFDMFPQPALRIRGHKELVEVYAVARARPRAFRLSTRGIEGIETKTIGRDAELKTLQESLLLTIEDREPQLITCVGEAGVGKSRLLYEFSKWVDGIAYEVILFQGRAIPQSLKQPYALLRDVLAFRFEILDSDPLPTARQKFEQGIAAFMGADSIEKAHFIGHLVGFDFSESVHIKQIVSDGRLLRERALGYLIEFFQAVSKTDPVIIQLEDIHWADDSSLDVMAHLVSNLHDQPLMIICMARPELYERRSSWGEGQPFHHRIDLKPLSKIDSRRLVREVLQKIEEVPTALRDLITERAEGNPFYLEELIKGLIEDGVIVKQQQRSADETSVEIWRVAGEQLSRVRVPPTLTGVLQARLDRRPANEKLLLQRASVLGRVFWDSAIMALSKTDGSMPNNLDRLLADLREREFIYQRETSAFAGAREYVIKHALLHDVIYETLLKRQQRLYHAAAAQWLVTVSGDRGDEYATVIAEHYEKAGDTLNAAAYLSRVGEAAYRLSAYDDADRAFKHALLLLDGDNRREAQLARLKVLTQQGSRLAALGNWQEIRGFLESNLALARGLDDQESIVDAANALSFPLQYLGESDKARSLLEEVLPIARTISKKSTLSYLLRRIGALFSFKGDVDHARPYLDEALAVAREVGDKRLIAQSLGERSNLYNFENDTEAALSAIAEVSAIAREIGAKQLLMVSLGNGGTISIKHQNFVAGKKAVEEGLAIARAIGSQNAIAWLLATLALAEARLGESITAEQHVVEALRLGREIGDLTTQLTALAVEGYLRVVAGQISGLELLGMALYHPQSDSNIRLDAEPLLPPLKAGPLQAMSEAAIQTALERGRQHDLEKTLDEVLSNQAPAQVS